MSAGVACLAALGATGSVALAHSATAPLAATKAPAVGDSCLVGAWILVKESDPTSFTWDGVTVPVAGLAGADMTITPGGTEVDNYSNSQPLLGTYQDQTFSVQVRGSGTSHDRAHNGLLVQTVVSFAMTGEYRIGGTVAESGPVHPIPSQDSPYRCSAKQLVTQAGNGTDTYTRQPTVSTSNAVQSEAAAVSALAAYLKGEFADRMATLLQDDCQIAKELGGSSTCPSPAQEKRTALKPITPFISQLDAQQDAIASAVSRLDQSGQSNADFQSEASQAGELAQNLIRLVQGLLPSGAELFPQNFNASVANEAMSIDMSAEEGPVVERASVVEEEVAALAYKARRNQSSVAGF
ncbi:MAG: hypothetical protein WCB86_07450 [Candidatus Dormiibacterota bacterium]